MTEAERIERAAEAMRSSQPWSSFWSLDDARLLARAAITAYLGGDVVVPREPSKHMIDIGFDAASGDISGDYMGTVEVQSVIGRTVYRAMISAAEMEG